MTETPGDERTLFGDGALDARQVDVARAEAEFNELSRALTIRSRATEDRSFDEKDIEKAAAHDEERFDLREYLSSSNDAMQSAGIKHKHVGVTWENLRVDVEGGTDHKVC